MDSIFDIQKVILNIDQTYQALKNEQSIRPEQLCNFLIEFSNLFPLVNSFLGIAFSDIREKTKIIRQNSKKLSESNNLIDSIREEIKLNIHKYNGYNNKSLKAGESFKNYVSVSRSLLRMMWFMTFIIVMMEDLLDQKKDKLNQILNHAYDQAFKNNHSWIIRNSAKIAMNMSIDRKKIIQIILGKYDQNEFKILMEKILSKLKPIWEYLWKFYTSENIDKLD